MAWVPPYLSEYLSPNWGFDCLKLSYILNSSTSEIENGGAAISIREKKLRVCDERSSRIDEEHSEKKKLEMRHGFEYDSKKGLWLCDLILSVAVAGITQKRRRRLQMKIIMGYE
ncbi:hypothetical protein C5167_030638 [Papaver somniferum]|nr:hypothetical protein C5167_030638 [Papaver somniferum]